MNFSRRAATPIVLALLVLGAALASSASATTPAWIIAGSPLATGETAALAESTTVTETFAIKGVTAGVAWKTQCTTMKLPKSTIEGERTRRDEPVRMEGCSLSGAAHCEVPSTIEFDPLTSTLEGTAGSFKLKFVPSSGTEVVTVNISGTGCAITGPFIIKGTMSCNYPGVETEAINHVLEFSLTSGSELKHAGEKVTLTGKDEFWLASGLKWKVA